jgi:NADH:ubiquinone oxidoreductase subunit E
MLDQIIEKHKTNKNNVEILQSIQAEFGYIPRKETQEIAKKLEIPLVKLWGVATFYAQFKLEKTGRNVIQICNGTACHVNSSAKLIDLIKTELHIKQGETTKDNQFSLQLVNCLGACAKAPTMMLNSKVYGQLTPGKLRTIINDLKKADESK